MNPHRARTKRRHPNKIGSREKPGTVAVFEIATPEDYQRQGDALRSRLERTPGRITPVTVFGWPGAKGIEALAKFGEISNDDEGKDHRQALVEWLTEHPEDWLLLARCFVRKRKGES